MQRLIARALAIALCGIPGTLAAQTRTFLVRLGVDTFAVERVTRVGDTARGEVVRHTPSTTVLKYALTFDANGKVASYEEGIYLADGTAAPANAQGVSQTGMKMRFAGDSVIREVTQNGQRVVKHNAAPGVTLPAGGGTSPYWQELVVQAAKRAGATNFGFYGFALGQDSPNVLPIRIIGSDSAEVLFPQGFRRGYKFDRNGQLLHGDASQTTVRLEITPVHDADIAAIARAWASNDATGQAMGVPSTRDSAVAKIGDATVSIDYGRPAKRGRVIWGKLVPFDTVWRLGANNPTILKTDKNLDVGGVAIPAGSYSLWLVPSAKEQSYLLVNKQTQGWVGVPMHDATQDLVKVPVRKHTGSPVGEERFRIALQSGKLVMVWDDAGYEVPLHSK